jgi:hypothetical protein
MRATASIASHFSLKTLPRNLDECAAIPALPGKIWCIFAGETNVLARVNSLNMGAQNRLKKGQIPRNG